ncbi:hypothetical protein B1R94_27545 [Mycolicibacterium litorale]|nr:hypothetical protein B1R94_27545 [Mycolicibacterium litorale]
MAVASHPWLAVYLCGAVVVTVVALAFAAWSRKDDAAAARLAGAPALLAGALWPVVAVGFVQWLLIHLLTKALEPPRLHRAALIHYGSRQVATAHSRVDAA